MKKGPIFNPGAMEYELYKGKFREINYIREKMAEKYVVEMAEKVSMEIPIVQKMDKLGQKNIKAFEDAIFKNRQIRKAPPLSVRPGPEFPDQ